MLIYSIVLGFLLFSISAKKKWKTKIWNALLAVAISLFVLMFVWRFTVIYLSNKPPNSEVIETVKVFDWKNKETLSSLGILPNSMFEGEFYVFQNNGKEYNFNLSLNCEDERELPSENDEVWVTEGNMSYICSQRIELNWLLIPEMISKYDFIIGDVYIRVDEHNVGQISSDFDRFVLEKLR